MQASVAGQLTEKASQAVDPEPKSSLETDHADSKVISRDFFWDQLIKVLTSGMLLIAALDIITSLTTEPVKCQAPNHFTRDQSAFMNSYCSEKTPKVDYFLFYIVGQAIVLVGPHVLWRSWFSGKLAHFMSVSLSLDRHRSNDTGEYVQDNFVKLKVLETTFAKSKVMHRVYFAKVLLQFLCIFVACVCSWAPFYEPPRTLYQLFHPVFDCQYTGPPTDYPNLENYIFNVKCVVPALRSHYAVWIINFILLGGTIICLCFAIVWWTIPHKLLNWRDATMFSLQSGIGHDHYHSNTLCPVTFRIRTDLDFLLLRLYDQDEGYGNVLHELLIISTKADIMHKAKETLSLIRGNDATGKAESGANSGICHITVSSTCTCTSSTPACTHTCMHTRMHTHTHTHKHTNTNTHTHTCTHTCVCAHTRTHTRTHIPTHAPTHARTHKHTHTHTHTHVHTKHVHVYNI